MSEYIFKYGAAGVKYTCHADTDQEAIALVKKFFSCIISFTPEELKEPEVTLQRIDYTDIDLTQ